MTTIRQLVTDAYREGGIVQIGDTPSAEEFDEGFRRLQTIVKSLIGNELGAPLEPLVYGTYNLPNPFPGWQDMEPEIDNYYVPSNIRLIANLGESKTVYLNPNPKDGARFSVIDNAQTFDSFPFTVNANGRRIEGVQSLDLDEAGVNKEWFYRDDLGQWVLLHELTANDQSPFPSEYDTLLVTMLALAIGPRYGASISGETAEELRRSRKLFRARYKQVTQVRTEEALVRMSSGNYSLFESLPSSDRKFDQGLIS